MATSSTMADFRSRYCEKYGVQATEFVNEAFRRCLSPHARFLAPLIRRVDGGYFQEDLEALQYLASAKGWRDARAELINLKSLRQCSRWSVGRDVLRLRLSTRKAHALVMEIFPVTD